MVANISLIGRPPFQPYVLIEGEIYKNGSTFIIKSLIITAQSSNGNNNIKTISFASVLLTNHRYVIKINRTAPPNLSGKLITFNYRINNASYAFANGTKNRIEAEITRNSNEPDPTKDNKLNLERILSLSSGLNIIERIANFVVRNS